MQVTALYHFAALEGFSTRIPELNALAADHGIRGTLLYAENEGINGMFCGPKDGLDALLQKLSSIPGLEPLEEKRFCVDRQLFKRFLVKRKKEIVSLGHPDGNPLKQVGTYVDPGSWNTLIDNPSTVTIDVRNDYEVALGTFKGALDPKTKTFREFTQYVERELLPYKDRPIAMCCTAGIRCEKASSYMLAQGFKQVYHLKGGILNYLKKVPQAESRWEGDCFVFDHRTSVTHDLEQGHHILCHACRQPLAPQDLASPLYEVGVSCHLCYDKTSSTRKAAFRQRHAQTSCAG